MGSPFKSKPFKIFAPTMFFLCDFSLSILFGALDTESYYLSKILFFFFSNDRILEMVIKCVSTFYKMLIFVFYLNQLPNLIDVVGHNKFTLM